MQDSVRGLVAALFFLFLLPSPAAAEGEDLIDFEFRQLKFEFRPEGVPPTHSDDPEGSALLIYIVNVSVVDFDALDLRWCIDGLGCSYPNIPGGNGDGTITQDEVEDFSNLIRLAAPTQIPEVANLTRMLRENVTVDGLTADKVRMSAVRILGAEGDTNSSDPLEVHVDVTALYANDPDASRHEITAFGLDLFGFGLAYDQVLWEVESQGNWAFVPSETAPSSVTGRVTTGGWFSNQPIFENATDEELVLVMERHGNGGGSSPSPGLFLAATAVAVALYAVRRIRA